MSTPADIALTQVGVKEYPPNSNMTKYGEWFGLDGLPWCAMFVSWCYSHAGWYLPQVGFKKGFASCQLGYLEFKKRGYITDTPIPGDIVLFDWNGDKRYDHTGIFVEWINKTSFWTVEGNTSLTNQSNGGEVMNRKRYTKKAVFIHIK